MHLKYMLYIERSKKSNRQKNLKTATLQISTEMQIEINIMSKVQKAEF